MLRAPEDPEDPRRDDSVEEASAVADSSLSLADTRRDGDFAGAEGVGEDAGRWELSGATFATGGEVASAGMEAGGGPGGSGEDWRGAGVAIFRPNTRIS